MTATRSDLKPWERQSKESAKAHAAFVVYRDLGTGRTFVATALRLRKNCSLIRRWSDRHHWAERVYAWDLAQDREREAATHLERQDIARRRRQHADRLERISMALFTRLIHQDPKTGEVVIDPKVKPVDAVRMYRLANEIERHLLAVCGESEDSDGTASPEDALRGLSNAELTQLIDVARERAGTSNTDGGEADDHD